MPLEGSGSRKDHLVGFALSVSAVVIVVPRLVASLIPELERFPLRSDVWADTLVTVPSWKPGSRYRNLFTGEVILSTEAEKGQALPVAKFFCGFPVAVQERMT